MVQEFLSAVVRWAETQEAITGVALVGSQARKQARPDSDVDVLLLTDTPDQFLRHTGWAAVFGDIASCRIEHWGMVTSLRVHYRIGPEVEFGFTTPAWAAVPIDAGTRRVVADGMLILLDRYGMLQHVLDLIVLQR